MKHAPYKLIAIDLDGTLLRPDNTVAPRVKQAVHRALSEGILVCFATGRNYGECQDVLEAVDHYASAVFVGGAVVMDTKRRVMLHRVLMEPSLAREVCGELEEAGLTALALQEGSAEGIDYLVSAGNALNAPTQMWMELNRSRIRQVASLASHSHEHTMRVSVCADVERCAVAERALIERFGERILAHTLKITLHGMAIVEVFDPAVNKWEGIRHVARAHGIADDEIVAIGDDMNDLAMIKNAGLGVAMGNARTAIRRVAKRVIGANHEDGLADFLEELLEQGKVQTAEEVDSDAA